MITAKLIPASANLTPQAVFLAILPNLEEHAQIQFRYIVCAHRRADQIAEAVALAWKWHLDLLARGKDVLEFPTAFISLVVTAVKSGRRVTGMEKTKDAMSQRAQHLHGYQIEKLADFAM